MKIIILSRVAPRLFRLGWVIASGMAVLPWFLGKGVRTPVLARIAWMQWMSRRFLSLLQCHVTVSGIVPSDGLIACNHISYVDILVLGSVCPAIFVAKSDVQGWPVFGWLSRKAGTIFVSRDTPSEVQSQLRKMEQPLRLGIPVVLFPEGTSSAGSSVLPFRSSLMQSALSSGATVTPVAIGYALQGGGDPGTEIAYWGDHTLLPHLLNLLSKESFRARLHFGDSRKPLLDRKSETNLLHREVSTIHHSLA